MKLCLTVVGFCLSLALNAQPNSFRSEYKGIESYLDSARAATSSKTDSLIQAYRSQLVSLDSSRLALQAKLDILHSNTETSRVRQAIDSLYRLKDKTIARLTSDLESLKSKAVGKLNQTTNELGLSVELSDKVSSLTSEIEKFSITSSDLDLGKVLPTADLALESNDLKLNTSLPQLVEEKNVIEDVANDLKVPNEITVHGSEIQELAKGDSAAINNLALTAEQKASELAGITDIKKEADILNDYKDELAMVQEPNALKEQGIEHLQQAAMNHFAGKEQVLQAAMDKMGKYKEKYGSLTSLDNVPKRPPNEMWGKPLIERLVPAFMVQVQKEGNDLLVDLNPYIGYRFTGKFTAGAGWNQRVGYDTKINDFTAKPRIYGPRVFAEYNLWKGFSPRVEVEVMNAIVAPENQPSRMDLGTREWVWGAFVGLKKEYRFIKNVKGTALVMTRLFDPDNKSPYSDVLNVRIGFEFPMKKKQKPQS